ncbi:MAG: hypothetical protein AB9921_06015 [Erysipelotrichaceae bacterium]
MGTKRKNFFRYLYPRVSKHVISPIFDYLEKHPFLVIAIYSFFTYQLYQSGKYSLAAYFAAFIILLLSIIILLKNLSDEYEKIIKITVLLIISFTVFAYLAALFSKTVIPKVFAVGSVDAWIGFAGSILGGSITMVALIFTLLGDTRKSIEQKNHQEILLAKQSFPTLEIIDNSFNSNEERKIKLFKIDEKRAELRSYHHYSIQNDSNYIAKDVKFTSVTLNYSEYFLDLENSKKRDIYMDVNHTLGSSNLIKPKGEKYFFIKMSTILECFSGFSIVFEIEYSDYLGRFKHHQVIEKIYEIGNFDESGKYFVTTIRRINGQSEIID